MMPTDPTVKAGSWGPKTVEKIIRIQERALAQRHPMIYLVDSAGARITDQVQMFPGRRGARMHTGVSGCGTLLVSSDEEGIDAAKRWLSYMPSNWTEDPPAAPPAEPGAPFPEIPRDENKPFDMKLLIAGIVDEP